MEEGGTELGFMSTTLDLNVAVKYSFSKSCLIFKLVPDSFMAAGADISWLSAFQNEKEILYPPLTYLKPTGFVETIEVRNCNFKIVEVVPTI